MLMHSHMFKSLQVLCFVLIGLVAVSCGNNEGSDSEFTGQQVSFDLIPGTVQGNTTSGQMVVRERSNGQAQIEITLSNVLNNANHPVHLHFGSLDDDGDVALLLNRLIDENGTGRSVTVLNNLDDNTSITYASFLNFDGSIKIHFEDSGPLENAILGSTNIGINAPENQAYLDGIKSITICNTDFGN